MKTINQIIHNLEASENKDFELFNNELNMQWTLRFEFIDNSILLLVNGSTLTSEWFNSLNELKLHLENSFINNGNYKIINN